MYNPKFFLSIRCIFFIFYCYPLISTSGVIEPPDGNSTATKYVEKQNDQPSVRKKTTKESGYVPVSSKKRFLEACQAFDITLSEEEEKKLLDKEKSKGNFRDAFQNFLIKTPHIKDIHTQSQASINNFTRELKIKDSVVKNNIQSQACLLFKQMDFAQKSANEYRKQFLLCLFTLAHTANAKDFCAEMLRSTILKNHLCSHCNEPFSLRKNWVTAMNTRIDQNSIDSPGSHEAIPSRPDNAQDIQLTEEVMLNQAIATSANEHYLRTNCCPDNFNNLNGNEINSWGASFGATGGSLE
ncbi:MAG: hypothetical protein OXE99_02145 [Cellvibrionales bacterium]|nr:hypothetical protein [Cellvibrionales bacterium]